MSPKVAIAQINSTVGDLPGNRERIAQFARQAATRGADIVLTPELSLTGYPPEDLLLQHSFHSATQLELDRLKNELAELDNCLLKLSGLLSRFNPDAPGAVKCPEFPSL